MKKLITITSSSFTVVILLTAILNGNKIAPVISGNNILALFAICLSISVLISLIDKIEEKIEEKYDYNNMIVDAFINFIVCYTTVFIGGIISNMFDFSFKSLLMISPIVIITFVITYIVAYIIIYREVNELNEKIQKKNK